MSQEYNSEFKGNITKEFERKFHKCGPTDKSIIGRHNNKIVNFMLLISCIFPKLIHQPIYALNKIQFKTNIKLLHVSAPGVPSSGII